MNLLFVNYETNKKGKKGRDFSLPLWSHAKMFSFSTISIARPNIIHSFCPF